MVSRSVDWYRNIRAGSALEVLTTGQRYTPVQRFLDSSELDTHLQRYVERSGRIRGIVTRTLGPRLDGSQADRANLEARGYRGVAFRPRTERTGAQGDRAQACPNADGERQGRQAGGGARQPVIQAPRR